MSNEKQSQEKFWQHFFEIYESIPRQGPGDAESTRRALRALPFLSAKKRILDIGCGAGVQTLDLARACDAQLTAVDVHPPFLETLARQAEEAGLAHRITAEVGDMCALDYPSAAFDVIWSEGSIFIVGFAKGLAAWRRLLAPGGYLVVSELCWLVDDPPAEVRAFFGDEGAAAAEVGARRADIVAAGYTLLEDFVLPEVGWWENYYVPLAASLERFRERHADDPEALAVAARSELEIEIYRKYPGSFGYVFFVMQRDEKNA